MIDSVFPTMCRAEECPPALSVRGCFSGLKPHGVIKCITNRNQRFILMCGWEMKPRVNEICGADGQIGESGALAGGWGRLQVTC